MIFILFLAVLWGLFWRGAEQDVSTKQDDTPKLYNPVVYDVGNWQVFTKTPKPFENIKTLSAPLGAVARKKQLLDIQGYHAESYHYHSDGEPPLYVVDSDKFFEVAWYYASSKDSDKDKAISQKYAYATYELTGRVVGNAKPLFESILANKEANLPTGVVLAQCKNYLCQVVFEKQQF